MKLKKLSISTAGILFIGSIAYTTYTEEINGALATPYCYALTERMEHLLKKKAPMEVINRVKERTDFFCSAETPSGLTHYKIQKSE